MRKKSEEQAWKTNGIRRFDYFLIIGISIAPMTALRIWKIGPGEVLCLIWGIRSLIDGKLKTSDLSRFFGGFIVALMLGTVCGFIIAPNELRISGIYTWIYLGIVSILLYDGLFKNTFEYNERLLLITAKVSISWYFFLYLYSVMISKSIRGIPLWYHGVRFSGGALNPHQVAVLFCGIAFVFFRKIMEKKKMIESIMYFGVCLYLLWQTTSSTGKMATVIGVTIALYLWIGENVQYHKAVMFVSLTVVIIIIAIIGESTWTGLFMEWVSEDPNGMGRFVIFSSFPETFMKSPVFGLGPGVHARNGYIEFHNTYFEVLAATGLFGGGVFGLFTFRLVRNIFETDWKLFPLVVALYTFGLSGFGMRRLVYWGLITFVCVLSDQKKMEQLEL